MSPSMNPAIITQKKTAVVRPPLTQSSPPREMAAAVFVVQPHIGSFSRAPEKSPPISAGRRGATDESSKL